MKTIKLKFLGFWSDFDDNNNIFTNTLRKHFNVVLSEEPDYLICSLFCPPFEYCKYDCVRIFFSGENFSPDFNVFDYAIGFDEINYNDRFMRFPLYLFDGDIFRLDEIRSEVADKKIEKDIFCNFIYSHQSSHGFREEIFYKLSEYSKVESNGSYLNNQPDGSFVMGYDKKKNYLKRCKFTIAVESTILNGFTTEKIIHPFASNSIPIYFGNPNISRDFNEKAFINCHDFPDVESIIAKVKELDEDENAYLEMLHQPVFKDPSFASNSYRNLENFLVNIFSQNLEEAYRRPRFYAGEYHNNHLINYNKSLSSTTQKFKQRLKNKILRMIK